MRKYVYCLLLTLTSILICNTLSAQSNQAARKLQLAEFAISRLYVDEVNEEELVEKAITSMLEELDPHSTYTNAEEARKMNEPLEGEFEGIGIQTIDGYFVALHVESERLVYIAPDDG